MDISYQVREANKMVYNKLSGNYEVIDGRRSKDLYVWLRKRLKEISKMVDSEANLLDIGCGAGFVIRVAKGLFSKMYGMDISENILKTLSSYGGFPICTDVQQLPFKNKSIDVVVLFSVIHHFYDPKPILNEIYRILKVGGVIYIDHDMNKYFFRNYHFFIKIYRRLSPKAHTINQMGIKEELYHLSEYHSEGIDSEALKEYLISLGFKIIKNYYHWYGLSKLTNFIFSEREFSKKIAPLFGFIAQK